MSLSTSAIQARRGDSNIVALEQKFKDLRKEKDVDILIAIFQQQISDEAYQAKYKLCLKQRTRLNKLFGVGSWSSSEGYDLEIVPSVGYLGVRRIITREARTVLVDEAEEVDSGRVVGLIPLFDEGVASGVLAFELPAGEDGKIVDFKPIIKDGKKKVKLSRGELIPIGVEGGVGFLYETPTAREIFTELYNKYNMGRLDIRDGTLKYRSEDYVVSEEENLLEMGSDELLIKKLDDGIDDAIDFKLSPEKKKEQLLLVSKLSPSSKNLGLVKVDVVDAKVDNLAGLQVPNIYGIPISGSSHQNIVDGIVNEEAIQLVEERRVEAEYQQEQALAREKPIPLGDGIQPRTTLGEGGNFIQDVIKDAKDIVGSYTIKTKTEVHFDARDNFVRDPKGKTPVDKSKSRVKPKSDVTPELSPGAKKVKQSSREAKIAKNTKDSVLAYVAIGAAILGVIGISVVKK